MSGLAQVRRIQGQVARHFGVPPASLSDYSRSKTHAVARQTAVWLARKHVQPAPSLAELGRLFGRDHSTILASIRRTEFRMKTEPRFATIIHDLEEKIQC